MIYVCWLPVRHQDWMKSDLPAVQPGSSIMPGKVNPVMPEMMNMVCYHVIGCDTTVAMASQAGQLELNVMMPVIAHHLLDMITLLTRAVTVFSSKCVAGIEANPQQASQFLARNPILATSLNPLIGYKAAAQLVQQAMETGQPIVELAREKASRGELCRTESGKSVTVAEIDRIFCRYSQHDGQVKPSLSQRLDQPTCIADII